MSMRIAITEIKMSEQADKFVQAGSQGEGSEYKPMPGYHKISQQLAEKYAEIFAKLGIFKRDEETPTPAVPSSRRP